MKLKKVILELHRYIKPYEPFLTEWMQHKHCSLNSEELIVIHFQINNNFKLKTLQFFKPANNIKVIQRIIAKLRWDYKKFKDWITSNFVFRLIRIASENHYNDLFLHLPLENISLSYKLKETLKLFKIKTFYEFFEKYNEQDLNDEVNFKRILDFEIISRAV